MAEDKEMNGGENNKKERKNGEGDKKKKEEMKSITVVLKVDMHCTGCMNKIIKCANSYQAVKTVEAKSEMKKLTVVGRVDPWKLREKLAEKTKKNVELISPQPPKEKDSSKTSKSDQKKEKPDEKKPKEVPVTVVLKVGFHCQGCIDKINRIISKIKGVQEILSLDREKEQVTVRTTMEAKALKDFLTQKLKRPVEIIPAKKDKDKDGGGKEGGGGGGGKKKGGNEEEKGAGKMEYVAAPGYDAYGYGSGYGYGPNHPPQMFSDENPNACFIM